MWYRVWLIIIGFGFANLVLAEPVTSVTITVFDNHDEFVRVSPAYGVSWALLEGAAERENIHLDVRNTVWQGARRRVKAHKTDLAFGALYSEERARWAYFSLPLATESSALYVPHSAEKRPVDLQHDVVGVSKGSIQQRYAEKAGFKNIYETRTAFNLFAALNGERVDYALLADAFVRIHCLREQTEQCPKPVTESLIETTVHFITANDNQAMVQVIDRLNQALLKFSQTEQALTIFNEYGYSSEHYQQWLARLASSSDLNRP